MGDETYQPVMDLRVFMASPSYLPYVGNPKVPVDELDDSDPLPEREATYLLLMLECGDPVAPWDRDKWRAFIDVTGAAHGSTSSVHWMRQYAVWYTREQNRQRQITPDPEGP